jgi:hypothetical protein
MNCSRCGKPINERKSYISSLGNDQKTEVSRQHISCFNAQFLDERDEEDEN